MTLQTEQFLSPWFLWDLEGWRHTFGRVDAFEVCDLFGICGVCDLFEVVGLRGWAPSNAADWSSCSSRQPLPDCCTTADALQLQCSAVQLHSTAAALPASWCLQLAVHHSTPWPAIWCNPTSSSSILAVELSKLTASAFSCILVQWYFSKRWMRLFIGKQCLAQQVSNTATMRSFTKHRKNCETALWGKDKLYWKISFIERKALLNERLYWKKEVIERKALL